MSMKILYIKFKTIFQYIGIPALIAILTFTLHKHILDGYWRFDDPQMLFYAINNPSLDTFYKPEVWQKFGTVNFTPLLTLSYKLDALIFGLNPYWFYFHQLVVIFLAGLLTYIMLRRWVSVYWSFLGSLLFLSGFPVFVSVQQIMTRHYLEGLIFFIIAFKLFLEFSEKRNYLNWLGGLCYLIAITAKEVYAPLIILLIIITLTSNDSILNMRQRITPYLLVAVLYVPWRLYMLSGGVGGYGTQLFPSLEAAI